MSDFVALFKTCPKGNHNTPTAAAFITHNVSRLKRDTHNFAVFGQQPDKLQFTGFFST
jgi:hypothetical protein